MSGSRKFTAVFEKVAVTAAQDLFEIVAPDAVEVRLISIHITQDTEEADAQAEMLSVIIHRGSTSGSGGSTVTPKGLNHRKTCGCTVEANNTTQSTEGDILWAFAWNVMTGLNKYWEEDERITIQEEERLIVELQDAPSDSITMSGVITFEEMRGI